HAAAFTTPSRDQFHCHCESPDVALATGESVEAMLRGIADTFLMQARNRTGADASGPLIRNKVRYENGGPFIGRFLVAPVPDAAGELAGIVMLFRSMSDESFDQEHLRNAAQLSRQ